LVRYTALGLLLAAVWTFNLRWIVHALRQRIRSEIYMHVGLGLFLTVPAVEATLGSAAPWVRLQNGAAGIAGLTLFLPGGALVIAAIVALRHLGRAGDLTESAQLVTTGVFRLLRQPMTLGIAIWSLALALVFQSSFSACLAAVTVSLMWLAARSEPEYNRRKFGQAYEEYARKVPMWNIFKSLLRGGGS
jgi:protein-S-isoprenylcysteine O-methyltransferase Ste14